MNNITRNATAVRVWRAVRHPVPSKMLRTGFATAVGWCPTPTPAYALLIARRDREKYDR